MVPIAARATGSPTRRIMVEIRPVDTNRLRSCVDNDAAPYPLARRRRIGRTGPPLGRTVRWAARGGRLKAVPPGRFRHFGDLAGLEVIHADHSGQLQRSSGLST